MARKKTPTNTNAAAAAVNLDDDEQLVEEVTTTKRIGREKRKPTEVEIVEPEPIEDDETDEPMRPAYPENSLASVLFDDAEEPFDNQFCTIQIRRNPDSMNDRFLTPCAAVTNLSPLRNIELTADKADIEDRVRAEHGGGHYFFQIYYDGAFRSSWKATLGDDPAEVARAKAQEAAKRNPTLAVPVEKADPMDGMLSSIVKIKQLNDALFGDREKRLETEIADLRRMIAERAEPAPAPALPENLIILEKALGIQNPTLQERLLDAAFPEETGGHWIPETVKTIFEHKDEIGAILSGLLGGLAPQPKPTAIQDLLRQQPPAELSPQSEPAPAAPSAFRRERRPSPEPTEAEGPPAPNPFGISPDEITEPSEGEVFVITPDLIEEPPPQTDADDSETDVDSPNFAKDAELDGNGN